ncbi:hypothetical protein GWI33_005473 [Rhynchophorus ferrugineus]|uniref:Uncharacterized protein n=1 Tax=Rhynchophorus ferrugineus TaxID=354439 RepID=A0A834MJJ7_RHYFE|nr:hypothetical protein GWI33_005473 [Rhynchophorus ferrugineus]
MNNNSSMDLVERLNDKNKINKDKALERGGERDGTESRLSYGCSGPNVKAAERCKEFSLFNNHPAGIIKLDV